jgi:hypothetical protein
MEENYPKWVAISSGCRKTETSGFPPFELAKGGAALSTFSEKTSYSPVFSAPGITFFSGVSFCSFSSGCGTGLRGNIWSRIAAL